jgi:hypothetical protein
MGGFLRRLRRPKEEEEAVEEPAPTDQEAVAPAESIDGSELQIPYRNDSPEESVAVAPDREAPPPTIAPEPAPVVEPSPEVAPTEATSAPTVPASPVGTAIAPELTGPAGPTSPAGLEPTGPSIVPTPAEPSVVSSIPEPDLTVVLPPSGPEAPGGPPPPLPEADRDAATSSLASHRPATKCFVCSTEMQGTFCPTCRMDWNE